MHATNVTRLYKQVVIRSFEDACVPEGLFGVVSKGSGIVTRILPPRFGEPHQTAPPLLRWRLLHFRAQSPGHLTTQSEVRVKPLLSDVSIVSP